MEAGLQVVVWTDAPPSLDSVNLMLQDGVIDTLKAELPAKLTSLDAGLFPASMTMEVFELDDGDNGSMGDDQEGGIDDEVLPCDILLNATLSGDYEGFCKAFCTKYVVETVLSYALVFEP